MYEAFRKNTVDTVSSRLVNGHHRKMGTNGRIMQEMGRLCFAD